MADYTMNAQFRDLKLWEFLMDGLWQNPIWISGGCLDEGTTSVYSSLMVGETKQPKSGVTYVSE
jgi:hypothetical protein